ncbi:MAG: efflux RND transporter permease subunit [Gammaproteobacteria bacterium]|nr:efflux RND transporter permease subunit [Gammaproteobacteria bacterium]
MRRFNLSAWALRNRGLVLYAMLVLALIGTWSYQKLGQSEDPPFTFKAMVVRTLWPGATAEQVSRQVTERIEKSLMTTGQYEFIRSYSRPGESQVIFMARDALHSREIPALWYQVRKKIADIRPTLPQGVVGPLFNDEFGDTFGNIYALTGPGFDYAILEDYAERIELELQRVPDVGKIELIGVQDEKIWIQLSNTRLATLGIPLAAVQQALEQQNAVATAGFIETGSDRVQLRVTGAFDSVEAIREFPIRAGDRTVALGDVATVHRAFSDPAAPRMRFMGEDAIGIALAMKDGGDILGLGDTLETEFQRLQRTLPAGMQLRKVSDQPAAVRESVGEFITVLTEAVAIVLLVSFFSLGFRTGLVVALSIPLVLAMTFAVMHYFGIGLHKISLGALVLALGLLVDDAIIAVEMMAIKMEQGYSRLKAASFAYRTTAFPMLTGTLVTAAGFLPIATAASSTGEYTRSLFQVVTIALVASWIAAVLFIPYLGDKLLPDLAHRKPPRPGSLPARWRAFRARLAGRWPSFADMLAPAPLHEHEHDPYQTRFYQRFRSLLPAANFAQFVVRADDLKARESLRDWLTAEIAPRFPELQLRVTRLENGPPVGYPLQFRVSGEHVDRVRALARQVEARVRANPHVTNVNLDWDEPSKVVRLHIDQDRARALGVSSGQLANFLAGTLSGLHVSTYREGNELLEVLLRGPADERTRLDLIGSLAVPTSHGSPVPLSQVATLQYGFEDGILWHRNRLPTVTVRADIGNGLTAPTVVAQIAPTLDAIRAGLPAGYLLETGGAVEDSARGQDSIAAGVPLFLFAVVTLLMLQLRSFSRTLLVLLTAPLGLIGVTLFLLLFRVPFGFVAMLGTIALAGMIMRNSVILVDQIEQDVAAGLDRWHAIIEATVRRFRPIVLTALAAILAMVPLSRSAFFGPMAVAIMGGLTVATALTLLFLPALYAAWFRVRRDEPQPA